MGGARPLADRGTGAGGGADGPLGLLQNTLGKLLAGFLAPTRGQITLDGQSLPTQGYCPVQLVFQNLELALNPRWRIDRILREGHPPPLHYLDALGIHPVWLTRYPHELSGEELQRVAIARVLNRILDLAGDPDKTTGISLERAL